MTLEDSVGFMTKKYVMNELHQECKPHFKAMISHNTLCPRTSHESMTKALYDKGNG
jgi:hypothetical protein